MRRCRGEDGLTLPISMILLVMLLGMSAVAVDVGHLGLLRRADQSAADVGAIAAAMNQSSEATMAQTALDVLNANLNETYTLVDLNTCAGDALPAGWSTYTGYNCLAHDRSWTFLRLRVPTKETETSFALLLGIEEVEHTAFAIVRSNQASDVLPLAVTAGSGVYECLKAGAGNVPDPACSGAQSGNFGKVTFGLWGNAGTGTTQDCSGNRTQFLVNLAQGLDHDLSIFGAAPHGSTPVIDTISCGSVREPNAVNTNTGNTPGDLGEALFGSTVFPDGGPSRLRRAAGLGWFGTTTIANSATVDDTPLWSFIPAGLSAVSSDVPASCELDQFVGDPGGLNPDNDAYMTAIGPSGDALVAHLLTYPVEDRMIRLLDRCLTHYVGEAWDDDGAFLPADPPVGCGGVGHHCTDPVFALDSGIEEPDLVDIQYSARFAYVPELVETSFPNGNSTVHIGAFRAVFLQRVYGGNCSNSGCDFVFDPGVGHTNNVNTSKANALTAFVFPPGSLPNGLADTGFDEFGANRFVELVR